MFFVYGGEKSKVVMLWKFMIGFDLLLLENSENYLEEFILYKE